MIPDDLGSPHRQESRSRPMRFASRIFLNSREIRSGWRLLIFAAIWFVIFVALLNLERRLSIRHTATRQLLLGEVLMLLASLVAAGALALGEKRSFADYALPLRAAFGSLFWWGILWGGAAQTGLLLLIRASHGFNFGPMAASGRRELLFEASVWAVGFLVVGLFEEFTFRGYALYTLTTGIGFWPAAVLLSLAFGAVHLTNGGENWIGALAAGFVGLFFCFTVRRTGSLWFAIGFHSMWDYAESFIYGVPDSGATIAGHIFHSALHGPFWLTGGSVGPEASIFIFVLIAVLFVGFHWLNPKARFAADGGART